MAVFGDAPVEWLGPADFRRLVDEMAETLGLKARQTEIVKTRSVFRFGVEHGLIDALPKCGPDFKPPSEKLLRKHRHEAQRQNGLRMFHSEQLRRILEAATPEMRAMVLLGVNCGFGNYDCATLSIGCLHLDGGRAQGGS